MAPKRAKKRAAAEGSSNVFSMFDQTQIQEFKEAFTVIDQNRDGIISKDDLAGTFAVMGRLNVKNDELESMIKEASGPINFTVFLTMFGEKLKGQSVSVNRCLGPNPVCQSSSGPSPPSSSDCLSIVVWAQSPPPPPTVCQSSSGPNPLSSSD
ncbi:myosin regulatory light chain 11-like, partial [Heptranchias perlo]|uniref:myosin regulatory light chain 11-like n=1 Tax=Heptranchias perlo TaxID=212740 RepID=UPI00355A8770